MPKVNIKQYIDDNLPSNNEIAISILRGVLKAMVDDSYAEFPENGLEYTQAERDKLNDIEYNAQVNPTSHEIEFINGLVDALAAKASITYVDNSINNLIDGAPTDLNTLKELADALGGDPDFYNSILTIINQGDNGYIPYKELQVFKGSSGTDDFLIQAGDRCSGWLTATRFLESGIYVSGDPLLITSYNPNTINYTDY